jgi:hypothetical protein
MRIAYVTTDEVNLGLALKMAGRCGATVWLVPPGDRTSTARFDAVLYDLASVPGSRRAALIEELCLGNLDGPTAIHGYCITDEQAKILRVHGVVVAHRLESPLIVSLARAARKRRTTISTTDAESDLTWVNLDK